MQRDSDLQDPTLGTPTLTVCTLKLTVLGLVQYRLGGPTFLSRPVDPDVPNPGTMHGSFTNVQAGITHAEASVMFKTWLQRTRKVNMYEPPSDGWKLDGQFVGQEADGPAGMLGTWELPAGLFGVSDVRERIQGSFGADYAP